MKRWTQRLAALLAQVPHPPGEALRDGISREASEARLRKLKLRPPESLLEWLEVSNGPCVGPGGLFGLATSRPDFDIAKILSRHPSWARRNWIPVAGDGFGNYYVLLGDTRGAPVGFIETIRDADAIEYLAASTLPLFLELLLRKELGEVAQWPFSRASVEALDPELLSHQREWPMPLR